MAQSTSAAQSTAFQSKPTPVNVLLEYLHNLFGQQNKAALFNVGDMVELRDKQTQMVS